MLSGIPASRLWRSRRAPTILDNITSSNSFDKGYEQRCQNLPSEDAEEEKDLAQLNEALECLTCIFQDIQVEVFREMLSTFSAESRLQLVTECLLKHKEKWVKGRWRVPDPCGAVVESDVSGKSLNNSALPQRDQFRSSGYKIAAKDALYQEFKNINHSAIKAILAEHNFSYLESRLALIELVSRSWRISVTNLILRRKLPSAAQCPLICWQASGSGSKEPTLIPTQSRELNEELEERLIADMRNRLRDDQIEEDANYAHQINEGEAESAAAMFECRCCFIPNVFERVVPCDTLGHFICFRCIRNSMNEAVFGQAWSSSIDREKASLNCIALQQGDTDSCGGCLPRNIVQRALLTQPNGRELWAKFEKRIAEEIIAQCQEPVSRCPFCAYAEIYTVPTRPAYQTAYMYLRNLLPIISFCLLAIRSNPVLGFILATLGCIYLSSLSWQDLHQMFIQAPELALNADPNFGTKFVCRNTKCSRVSCLQCRAPWIDIHICHQSSRQALRTFIESAVTDAIKRTCPKCNLSFVKSSGCNKLVCICGYSMCYVCRQDVGKEGYAHFCPHFRANPGQACEECDRCDLYRTEDEDKVIAEARRKAIATWKEQKGEDNERDELCNEITDDSVKRKEREMRKRWPLLWF